MRTGIDSLVGKFDRLEGESRAVLFVKSRGDIGSIMR